ncbi:hypothetical protein V7S43_003019 [Phytophthora oleae]|uniref:Cystatin domain-containing protein n=1 Tax=Phytophthora oleae TaxID=2107226 RepID=A0ABD3FZK2_9STRA
MHAALPLLVAFPALASARNVVTIGMTGGWRTANVTEDNTQLLDTALSGSSYAKSVGDTRVCFSEVTSVETQVVAGTNYRFHIDGCDVTSSDGECSASTLSSCKLTGFAVQIFEQTWSDTLKVTSIKAEERSTSTSTSAASEESDSGSEETMLQGEAQQTPEETTEVAGDEKKAVDAWIEDNGLNQYGDPATVMYTGGTPLFDENTGTTTDRYEYILRHHPERPWLAEVETTKLLAVEKAETEVDETKGQGSVAGVLSMLGVFTVVLAGVAILKMHQGRRDRFRYNPIHSRDQ